MKKTNKLVLFAITTAVFLIGVYFFDYRAEQNKQKQLQAEILNYDIEQISFVQIVKGDIKIGLQRAETGWSLLEPVQDQADNAVIEDLLAKIKQEKQIAVVRQSEKNLEDSDLKEFGLDAPAIVFNFKNNLGNTKKISVGSVKNFEGNSYLRSDSENKIIIASPFWNEQAQKDMIYYREKKLYRQTLAHISKIRIKSLSEEFEIHREGDKWQTTHKSMNLDQNRIREILKKISETNIEEYLFEGEPSVKQIAEKGLTSTPVRIELSTDETSWAVNLNVKPEDKAVYGLTERPTFLVKVDSGAWETFGNITLDSLRDRSSALSFNLNEVKKIYFKQDSVEAKVVLTNEGWKSAADMSLPVLDEENVKSVLNRIHDLKISEFVDTQDSKSKFEGNNMLILNSDTEKLVLQLNWGPSFKIKDQEYYYARTQLSDSIFAIEKKVIESLGLAKLRTQSESLNAGEKIE